MKSISLLTLVCGLLVLAASHGQLAAADSVRVITDRTESHLKPLFKHFTGTTGIEVEAVYVDKGLLPRLKAQPTEADLVISKTAENLEQARVEGLLTAIPTQILEGVKPEFIDQDRMYVTTSWRARGCYVSKERVDASELQTYMDLTKPRFAGKVAVRSGYHDYNISLFCQMAEAEGIDYARAFITGLKKNLCRTPTSNDRGQVKAIHDGLADASIGNSYYMGLMLNRDDQRPWAESVNYLFPNQDGKGTYVMRAAAGLTTSERNVEGARQLLGYLLDDFAQYFLTNSLHVYPVIDSLPISDHNKTLGSIQDSVEEGRFKACFLPLRDVVKHREAVVEILNEVNFDQ